MSQDPTIDLEELDEETNAQNSEESFYAHLQETFGSSAPTKAWVEKCKTQSGRVRVVAFTESEVYFYRGIRSAEYKSMIQQAVGAGKELRDQTMQVEILKDRVVTAAVLWPKLDPTELGSLYAGTKDSLFELIREASNFIDPDSSTVMIREL